LNGWKFCDPFLLWGSNNHQSVTHGLFRGRSATMILYSISRTTASEDFNVRIIHKQTICNSKTQQTLRINSKKIN
jgi:hypothetical protein